MSIEHLMREHGIERVVYLPASELAPYDIFHVHLFDGHLGEHIGRGNTIEEALKDAVERVRGRVAA